MTTSKKGKVYTAQAREVIFNVHQFMLREATLAKTKTFSKEHFQCVQERTATATGVSRHTVGNILNEANNSSASSSDGRPTFKTPTIPGRPKNSIKQINDLKNIRKKLHKSEGKGYSTRKILLEHLRKDIDFNNSTDVLKNILLDLGFTIQKNESVKQFQLSEKEDVRLGRAQFLQEVREKSGQGHDIVYAGYMTLDTGNPFEKDCNGQYIVALAGSEWGLMIHALHVFKTVPKVGNGDEDENQDRYEMWFCQYLLPNLRSNSYIVLDGSTYNNGSKEFVPNFSYPKEDLVSWLTDRNIKFDPNISKSQLYKLVKKNKTKRLEYSIDKSMFENGHKVLRLPCHSSDLNPLETIWIELQEYASDKIVIEMSPVKVKEILLEKLQTLELEFWQQLLEDAIAE